MADRKAIFIVEDEPMIGMMLEDFLETLGYAPVAIAETLVLAEEKAKSVPFDGAILDCNIGTEKVWPVADYLMGKACRSCLRPAAIRMNFQNASPDRKSVV